MNRTIIYQFKSRRNIDGAIRGLEELKKVFDMKGANAITIERAMTTLENAKQEIYTLNKELDKIL